MEFAILFSIALFILIAWAPEQVMMTLLKQVIHWAIAIAVVLQLFSCVFMGVSYMPEMPW